MARGGIVRNLAGLGAAGGLAAAGAINAAGGPACDAERRRNADHDANLPAAQFPFVQSGRTSGRYRRACDAAGDKGGIPMHDDTDTDSGGEHSDAELVTILDDWLAAIAANDAKHMASVMSDDWVLVSETGPSTKEQFMSFVESGKLTHSAMQRVSETRVRVYGDTAVLTARVTNTAHYGGQRFDADEWTSDVLVKRDGRWLCVLSQITAAAAPPVLQTSS